MTHRPAQAPRDPKASRARRPEARSSAGFTITEAVVALGLTLTISAGFAALFRQGRLALDLQPELAGLRQDGRAILRRIAADLERAGAGLPVEIPVFTDLARAGDQNPDGLDFLAAPDRAAEVSFEPVVAFDGDEAWLEQPESRLDGGFGNTDQPCVVVFNDDEMTPRWAFGQVVSIQSASGGAAGLAGALLSAGAEAAELPVGEGAAGAAVRIQPRENPWHWHFRPSVDADTFEPGSGGGLLERGLQSALGGAIEAAVPGLGSGALASLTNEVVGAVLEQLVQESGVPAGAAGDGEDTGGYGLFGLGQPGLVPATRIRYWLSEPDPGGADQRRVLMRQEDEAPAQPVGYAEDLQVHYVTGEYGDVLLDSPPPFAGDMTSAARLRDHVVRAVDVMIRVRAPGNRVTAGSLTRTYRRRVALRVATAGVERRAWEEIMQLNSLPTEIPKIGPLRYLPLPW